MHRLKENGMKWLGLCLLYFVPLVLLYIVNQQISPIGDSFLSTSHDFQYAGNDGIWHDYDFNKFRDSKVTGTYWFKTTLPENQWRDPYLYLVFVPNVEVYIEDELLYTYEPFFEYLEHPHLIKLPNDFSNQTLTIRINFNQQLFYPGTFIIDSPLNLVMRFIIQSDYRFILSFISFFVGIIGFILFIGRRQASYFYFSLFALYISQLCASRSWSSLGLLTSSPAFPYFQDVLLIIGSYFFIKFYESMFGSGLLRIRSWISKCLLILAVCLFILSLFFSSIYLNQMSFILQNILVPLILVYILVSSIRNYRYRQDKESFWWLAGIVTLVMSGLFYFLYLYFLWTVETIAPHWRELAITVYQIMIHGDRFLHGVFILLFCMVMILSLRVRSVYEEAQKTADELAKLSNSLEQLVKERTEELEKTNQNLRSSMQETAEALAEIAVMEDRNRIAQDMHDRTGHALTAALIQIEAAKWLTKKDPELVLQKLESVRQSVVSGLESIRETVRMLKLDYDERSLVPALQKLIQETEEAVGIKVLYNPQPIPDLDPIKKKTLYLALQEGLTNGIRHAKAERFNLILKTEDNNMIFQLMNDGIPYENQAFGFGLNSMKERIERLHGTLRLHTDEKYACVLRIKLPIDSHGIEEGE